MGFIDNFLARYGYKKAEQQHPPAWSLRAADVERWNIPDYSLARNQAELYQRLSWVYAAVNVVATVSAGVALNVKKVNGERLDDVPNHPFEMLMRRPNPHMSRGELMTATYSDLRLTGNAYWWINRRNPNAAPDEVWNIPPYKIQPVPDGRQYLKGYAYDPGNGQIIPLDVSEVVHFHSYHPTNQFVGLSPVEPIATQAAADMQTVEWFGKLYGENNARLPGILSFSDAINDSDWERLKSEIKDASAKRQFMMLRGVGAGGVNFVQAAATLKEMEFITGRTMTKEEIWSVFAPGLSSMLAVNATEANSKTGKATLIDFAVWPMVRALAERVTLSIMPAYGPEMVLEADDIRVTDQVLRLQEIVEFSRTHTVNEVRVEYWASEPLEDDRGELFPAQVDTTIGDGEEPEPPAPIVQTPPPSDNIQPEAAQPETAQAEDDASEPDPAEAEQAQAMRRELRHWRVRAEKAFSKGETVDFVTEAIPQAQADAIRDALKSARTLAEVRAVFDNRPVDPLLLLAQELRRANDLLAAAK